MKWLQIHITVDQAQVDFTETLLESLGAVSVTLDDAENQDLLEPLPGETPLWNKVIATDICWDFWKQGRGSVISTRKDGHAALG